ncbi:MAG: hypothetical protein JST39_16335 [Bacteroidetes bacterium]|nr:hypothetical protein [Bacteroidota bacterium]
MAKNLGEAFDPRLLQQYMDLREERLYFDSLDTVYLKLANRLVAEVEHIRYLPLVHGMVTIIIDRFLYRMNARMQRG